MVLTRTLFPAVAAVALAATPLFGQLGEDIPLGFEVVTGFRSDYVFRGFDLAENVLDVQLETEVALTNEWVLSLGGWYGTGADGFSETSGYVDLDYRATGYSVGFSASYHDYAHVLFQSGVDLGATFTWEVTGDLDVTTGAYYDTGAEGYYAKAEAAWSKPLTDDSYLSVLGGIGGLSDYYGRSGLGDLYTRLAYTYTFNPRVAVTPFIGSSLALDSDPQAADHLFAGLWFEVNF